MAGETYTIQKSGATFTLCEECGHVVGWLKTACPCDGSCHPVKEPWEDYVRRTSPKKKRSHHKKKDPAPRRSYQDISQAFQ